MPKIPSKSPIQPPPGGFRGGNPTPGAGSPLLEGGTRIPLPLVTRWERFNDLVRMVQGCRACPGMDGRRRVLSINNGGVPASVMFVAEAPGKDGADRTGMPLNGDPSGANFETLLQSIGWTRDMVFITNAVLCNPRDGEGKNRAPADEEVRNCSFHLADQIRLVAPRVIVTLGRAALNALRLIEPHSYDLARDVGTPCGWMGRIIFPLYHPSPRVLGQRPLSIQRQDFTKLKELVDAQSR